MNEMKADWDDLRLFLAVARGGGLAAAAEATGKSAPTLGRRMVALERRLARELFLRRARGYALTADGARLLAQLEEVEARLRPVLAETGAVRKPVVKVSAGAWMTHVLCRHVGQILGGGDVALRFIAADHTLDMRHREAVIGVRNRRPDQAGLAGRFIARVQFAVYATGPEVATWVRVIGPTPSAAWAADHIGNAPAIEVTSARSALDLAETGAARAVLPCFVGDRAPGVMRVSGTIDALDSEQWLVLHADDRFEPPVRRVIDRIERVIRDLHAAV